MREFTFALKNMISRTCIRYVELCFREEEGVELQRVELGQVQLRIDEEKTSPEKVKARLKEIGFEVIEDRDAILTEKVKLAAIELIMYANNKNSLIRNSDYISDKVQEPYDKISKVFSKVSGMTLEKFIILLKIEKIKEMILQDELTLSEIAYQLGYSSVQYLSRQFKQITGYTFSEFKELENPPIRAMEELI